MIISAQSQNIVTEKRSEGFSTANFLMLISLTANVSSKHVEWILAWVSLINISQSLKLNLQY